MLQLHVGQHHNLLRTILLRRCVLVFNPFRWKKDEMSTRLHGRKHLDQVRTQITSKPLSSPILKLKGDLFSYQERGYRFSLNPPIHQALLGVQRNRLYGGCLGDQLMPSPKTGQYSTKYRARIGENVGHWIHFHLSLFTELTWIFHSIYKRMNDPPLKPALQMPKHVQTPRSKPVKHANLHVCVLNCPLD